MRFKLMLIPTLALSALSAYAAATSTPITFYNNTNTEVQVSENNFYGQLINCQGNPYFLCVQQQSPITIDPHSSGTISLVTAVSNPQTYQGAVGFSITTDGTSINTAVIPVMANPAGAFALTSFLATGTTNSDANSQNQSYASNAMPQYVASVAQNIQNGNGPAIATVVSINPVQQ